jgi:hypothetical protein
MERQYTMSANSPFDGATLLRMRLHFANHLLSNCWHELAQWPNAIYLLAAIRATLPQASIHSWQMDYLCEQAFECFGWPSGNPAEDNNHFWFATESFLTCSD